MPNQQSNLEQQFNQPPPPISSPPQKPKFNLKYILIVAILAAIGGGGVLTYQYWWLPRHETKPPEITIKNETADWQTYRNEELGFEMKYPIDLQVKTISDAVSLSLLNKNNKNLEDFLFMVFETEDLETKINERRDFLFRDKAFKIEDAKEEKVFIDNIIATKFSAKVFSLMPEINFEYSRQIDIFINENKKLHIFVSISPEEENKNFRIFDKILSTFKFIK